MGLATALAFLLPAQSPETAAHNGGIVVQVQDGKLITGFDGELGAGGQIGDRAFSLLFPPSTLAIDVPSFLSLAAAPFGTEPLPQGAELHFDLLPMTIDGETSNLFYWDGLGASEADVTFGSLPQQGVTLTLFDPNFVATVADGAGQMMPGQVIDVTSTTNDNLRLHAHRFFLLDDGDDNEATTPPDGIYLMALQLRMEGLRASDPLYIVSAGFQNLTPSVVDALDNAALPWVEERADELVLDGDYDFNGIVDGSDFLQWQRNHNYDGPFPINDAYPDGDGDGVVNAPDLAIWEANFVESVAASPASGAVPEPASIALICLAIAAGISLTAVGRSGVRR